MKKRIFCIVTAVLLLLVIPSALLITGFCLPAQFGESFYGELPVLFDRLKNTEGKKIVFVGNSALAFGLRPDLLKNELDGYEVLLFGLYGAIGTKTMLDLSRVNIGRGDLVVIAPELYSQTCSLYFSPDDLWRAADGDLGMLGLISREEGFEMAYAFPGYAAGKYSCLTGARTIDAGAAYRRSAFEDADGANPGYMTFDRPCNTMAGGYDAVNLPTLDRSVFGEGFIGYLNDYARFCREKGASVYFGFTPMNSLCFDGAFRDASDAFYRSLCSLLDFPVLGHPEKYAFDYRLFYDNNVHVNSIGALYYTDALAEDLKFALGCPSRNSIDLPSLPALPE